MRLLPTIPALTGAKEQLLAGIMEAGLEELLRAGREAVEYSADPAVQLGRLVMAHVAIEAVNPLTSSVIDREVRALTGQRRALVVGLRDDYDSLFQRVLERGARTGQFQLTDLRVTRFVLLESCNGVKDWYRPGGRLSVADLQDRFVELACRLVGSRAVTRGECGPEVTVRRLDSEPVARGEASEDSA